MKISIYSVISLILGIFSFLGFTLLASIPGVVLGHIGLKEIKLNPETICGKGYSRFGLILGYTNIVLTLIILLLFVFSTTTGPLIYKIEGDNNSNITVEQVE